MPKKSRFRAGFVRLRKFYRDGEYPILKIIIFVSLGTVLTLMFPHGESREVAMTVGRVWVDKDLISPFSFPIAKDPASYRRELEEAENSTPPVFRRNENALEACGDSLRAISGLLSSAVAELQQLKTSPAPRDSAPFLTAATRLPFQLTTAEWETLLRIQRSGSGDLRSFLDSSVSTLLGVFSEIYSAGVIDTGQIKQHHPAIALRRGNREDLVPVGRLYEPAEARDLIQRRITSGGGLTAGTLFLKSAMAVFSPNLLFDREQTEKLIQTARDNVPRTIGFVQENERIISKHERITEEDKLKLDSFLRARAERAIESGRWRYWLGSSLHVALVIALFGIYIYLFRRKIYRDNGKLILIGLIILMEAAFAYLTVTIEIPQPIQFLIFVPAASMLLTIIFDSRIGFYGTVTIALLVAGIRGNDYAIALISVVAGGFAAYTVRDIRNRTQIFRSLVFIFLGYTLSILALAFEQFEPVESIAVQLSFAFANAVFSPVITYGLLIFFEKAFRVTTDLTLLELSDFNHPLLRQLSEKAPGTFHHSMVLGNMAESAAEAIGANPILARVGAYYHDIGKMLKPEYFVENQRSANNKHSRLRPRMSALIIASHVKDGGELGREYRLPENIIDFIYQHHGTNRISFFYDKALKQAERKQATASVREEDFRYPGPKPQSKEAGIVMLADSVEASMRSVENLSPVKMGEHIEEMSRRRFLEGELDECELTLKDLSKIKGAFLKILVGIHHQRIKYPESGTESGAAPSPDGSKVAVGAGTATTSAPAGQSAEEKDSGEETPASA